MKQTLLKIINIVAAIIIVTIFLFPFIWMIMTSVKTFSETLVFPPRWIPEDFQWDNYLIAWNSGPFLRYTMNSIIVTLAIIVFQLITVIPAAYAYARFKFRGRGILFTLTMSTMMIPAQLIFLPVYLQLSDWGLLDTLWALILPFASSAFGIFLIRQAFMQIPEELLEAARLDNTPEWKIILKIMVPMSKPVIITFILFSFVAHWNDYFWPLVMTTTDHARTLPLGIAKLREVEGMTAWHILMAGNVMLVIPILVVFFFTQKHIIRAFVYSGVK